MKCLLMVCLSVVVKTKAFGNREGGGVECDASQLQPPLSQVKENTS
jgi:hypothetical protein